MLLLWKSSPLISGGPFLYLRCSGSSLPPLVSEGCGLVCECVCNADMQSDHFDSKQSWEAVDLPLICHPSPSLTTFALRWREVRHLLLDLDTYYVTDPWGMFHLFLKRTADVIAPILVNFHSIISWNIQGLNTKKQKHKVQLISELANNENTLTITLTETYLN